MWWYISSPNVEMSHNVETNSLEGLHMMLKKLDPLSYRKRNAQHYVCCFSDTCLLITRLAFLASVNLFPVCVFGTCPLITCLFSGMRRVCLLFEHLSAYHVSTRFWRMSTICYTSVFLVRAHLRRVYFSGTISVLIFVFLFRSFLNEPKDARKNKHVRMSCH